MSVARRMAASPKTSSTVNWRVAREPLAARSYVCKRDVKALRLNTERWEDFAAIRCKWRSTLAKHLKSGEDRLISAEEDKWTRRKESHSSNSTETTNRCELCDRDCHSRIDLCSHRRRCSSRADNNYDHHPWSSLTDGGRRTTNICLLLSL